jgi:HdeA/HdeB family
MSRRFLALVAIAAICQFGLAGAAFAKKTDPSRMSCEEYLSLDTGEQTTAAAFVEGWSHGKKHEEIGEVGVDRDVTTLVASCKEIPKESLARRFEKHVPVLKKHVKPIEMKCEDFVGLESDVQPELYYYLDGYNRATHTATDVAGEVDLEQDYQAFVQVCKQAPKESFWSKLKAHLDKKK